LSFVIRNVVEYKHDADPILSDIWRWRLGEQCGHITRRRPGAIVSKKIGTVLAYHKRMFMLGYHWKMWISEANC